MNIDEIRNTFDKGSLIFDKNKLSVFYMCIDGCGVSQGISNTITYKDPGNYKTVFEKLIAVSDELVFRVIPGGKMYIDFTVKGKNITDKTCWFLPVTKSLTKEDYKKIQDEAGADIVPEYRELFNRQFQDADLLDIEELKTTTVEWLDMLSRSNVDRKEIEASRVRFPHLVEACRRFFSRIPLGHMEVIEPEPEFGGSVEFQITAGTVTKCKIIGANKDLFLSMVERADTVGIEMTCDGPRITFVDLDFYS